MVSCHPGWTLTEGVEAAYGEKKSYLEVIMTSLCHRLFVSHSSFSEVENSLFVQISFINPNNILSTATEKSVAGSRGDYLALHGEFQ